MSYEIEGMAICDIMAYKNMIKDSIYLMERRLFEEVSKEDSDSDVILDLESELDDLRESLREFEDVIRKCN